MLSSLLSVTVLLTQCLYDIRNSATAQLLKYPQHAFHFLNYAFLKAHQRNKTCLIVDCTLSLPLLLLMNNMVSLFRTSVCTLSILLLSSIVAGIMEDRRRVRFDPIYDHSYSEVSSGGSRLPTFWNFLNISKRLFIHMSRYWTAEC